MDKSNLWIVNLKSSNVFLFSQNPACFSQNTMLCSWWLDLILSFEISGICEHFLAFPPCFHHAILVKPQMQRITQTK